MDDDSSPRLTRINKRAATARNCLSLLKQRSTVLRLVYQEEPDTGGGRRTGRGYGGASSGLP
jgi:hypothetical protein